MQHPPVFFLNFWSPSCSICSFRSRVLIYLTNPLLGQARALSPLHLHSLHAPNVPERSQTNYFGVVFAEPRPLLTTHFLGTALEPQSVCFSSQAHTLWSPLGHFFLNHSMKKKKRFVQSFCGRCSFGSYICTQSESSSDAMLSFGNTVFFFFEQGRYRSQFLKDMPRRVRSIVHAVMKTRSDHDDDEDMSVTTQSMLWGRTECLILRHIFGALNFPVGENTARCSN